MTDPAYVPALVVVGVLLTSTEGTFSLQANDPWTMWNAIARRKQVVLPNL